MKENCSTYDKIYFILYIYMLEWSSKIKFSQALYKKFLFSQKISREFGFFFLNKKNVLQDDRNSFFDIIAVFF